MASICGAILACQSGCGYQSSEAAKAEQQRERAVKEVKKYGGEYQADSSLPGNPVVRIDLENKKVIDASLAAFSELDDLRSLSLEGTFVTDDGLQYLKNLPHLQKLELGDNNISDAGLRFLEGLAELQVLSLSDTRITDGGLPSLSKLTKLQKLYLSGCHGVTAAGVKKLQQLLPWCEIKK
jgi:hypothetical protein